MYASSDHNRQRDIMYNHVVKNISLLELSMDYAYIWGMGHHVMRNNSLLYDPEW